MGDSQQQAPIHRFPVGESVRSTCSLAFGYFGTFLRAAWLPVVLYVVGSLGLARQGVPMILLEDIAGPGAATKYLIGPGGLGEYMLYTTAVQLLMVPAATVWIRLTVLGPPEDGRFLLLSLGRAEVQYVLAYVLIILLASLLAVAGALAVSIAGGILGFLMVLFGFGWTVSLTELIGTVGSVFALAVFIFVIARLVPVLGRASFGRRLAVSQVWRKTKPASAELFWATLIIAGTMMLAQFLINLILGTVLSGAETLIGGAIGATFQVFTILLGAVFTGRVYAFFEAA